MTDELMLFKVAHKASSRAQAAAVGVQRLADQALRLNPTDGIEDGDGDLIAAVSKMQLAVQYELWCRKAVTKLSGSTYFQRADKELRDAEREVGRAMDDLVRIRERTAYVRKGERVFA
jgi:hypothetical protein